MDKTISRQLFALSGTGNMLIGILLATNGYGPAGAPFIFFGLIQKASAFVAGFMSDADRPGHSAERS